MYNTLHSAISVSAALALYPDNPPLALLVGVLIHYATDAIPHGDDASPELLADRPRFVRRMVVFGAIDFSLLAILCSIWLWQFGWSWTFAMAALGAALPDIMLGVGYILRRERMFGFLDRLHDRIHNPLKVLFSPWIGLAGQAVLAGLIWWRLL